MKEVYQSTHVTFADLEPGHTYYFRLRADISGRMSILTKPVSGKTSQIGASCTLMHVLHVVSFPDPTLETLADIIIWRASIRSWDLIGL